MDKRRSKFDSAHNCSIFKWLTSECKGGHQEAPDKEGESTPAFGHIVFVVQIAFLAYSDFGVVYVAILGDLESWTRIINQSWIHLCDWVEKRSQRNGSDFTQCSV